MRYCTQHSRAYQPYVYGAFTASGTRSAPEPPHWRPFPAVLVAVALRWAKEGRCRLEMQQVACDVCLKEEEAS